MMCIADGRFYSTYLEPLTNPSMSPVYLSALQLDGPDKKENAVEITDTLKFFSAYHVTLIVVLAVRDDMRLSVHPIHTHFDCISPEQITI